jgi:hypothetical protein
MKKIAKLAETAVAILVANGKKEIAWNYKINQGTIMLYVLQSLGREAKAVWLTETLPMPKAKADRVAQQRLKLSKGNRRYRLVPVELW